MERAILIYKDTEEIIKEGWYPRKDIQPIVLEEGLEWLLIKEIPVPEYDDTQKVQRNKRITNEYHTVYTHLRLCESYWEIINKSEEELEADLISVEDTLDVGAVKRLLQRTADTILTDEVNLTEQDIQDIAKIYSQWRPKLDYSVGQRVVRGASLLFEVLQAHKSQPTQLPENTSTVYKQFTVNL